MFVPPFLAEKRNARCLPHTKTKRKQGRSTHTRGERGQTGSTRRQTPRIIPAAFGLQLFSGIGAFSRASKFSRNEKPAGGPTEDNPFDAPAERGTEAPRPLHPDINTKQDTRRRVRDMKKKKRQARQDRKIVREHTKIRLIPGSCLPPPPSRSSLPLYKTKLNAGGRRRRNAPLLPAPPPLRSLSTHEGPSNT